MKAIYITSTEAYAGKTSLAIGLGLHLQRDGYRVGYLKPVTAHPPHIDAGVVSEKVAFIRQELALAEPEQDIAPLVLTESLVEQAMGKPHDVDFKARLVAAFKRTSADKDILLLEGGDHPLEGALLDLSSLQVVDLLDAQVVVVVRYQDSLSLDTAAGLRQIYGDRLLGIVLNAVPRAHMRFVQETAGPMLEERGLPVFAVLPEERLLASISVRELVEQMNGEILCCGEQADGLIEYLMVGAMTAGSALTYFRSRPNKAVITGGDRHDVQLAALETSTRCLILTGGQQPSTVVLNRACEVGVPIVVVQPDTLTTVRAVERIFGKTFVRQPRKSAHFATLLEERFDFRRLYGLLDLEP
jgi:BioD-like phosphotransacetylase family protein